jgi:sugar lactone lactonase YvrE
MATVEHLLTTADVLGEGPIWHTGEQRLYWICVEGGTISRWSPTQADPTTFEQYAVGMKVGCIAFWAGGGLIVGAEKGIGVMPAFGEPMQLLQDNSAYPPAGERLNDGAADRQGRFWVGSMSQAPENKLYRMTQAGDVQVAVMETGLTISNGIGWSPDKRSMYLSDSGVGCIYAYDFAPETGDISNRRVLFEAAAGEGVADGLTVDSEGAIWAAFWDGWKVARIAPDDGRIMQTVPMPVQRPTSVAFGGADLNELYVSSAKKDLSPAELTQQPQAGHLFRVRVGVRGLPEPQVRLSMAR